MKLDLAQLRVAILTREGLPPWVEPFARPLSWALVYYRALERDQAFVRAAGMAYTTLVALVPLLLLVFGLLDATGILERDRPAIEALVFESFLGDIPEVRETLLPGLLDANLGALGLVGIGGLGLVTGRLYLMVEKAYCDIFGVPVRRPLHVRVLMFYVLLTVVPVVFVAVFLQTGQLISGLGLSFGRQIALSMLQMVVLVSAIRGFPATRVRWVPALVGAAVSFVLLNGASMAFQLYLRVFAPGDPVRLIYGSLGVLPVFLLWLYVVWLMVLLGVEVAAVAQDHRSMMEAERDAAFDARAGRDTSPEIDVALWVLACIADHWEQGAGPVTAEQLSEQAGASARDLSRVLRVLDDAGYVAWSEEGWLLARPARSIALREVVTAWREMASPVGLRDDVLAAVRSELDGPVRGTLAEAVERWRREGTLAGVVRLERARD